MTWSVATQTSIGPDRKRDGQQRTEAGLQGRALVVFDVDGTLYDQKRLRRAMALRLAVHLALTARPTTLRVLAAYRRMRETMADQERDDFEEVALTNAAAAGGTDVNHARALVVEWMHVRPLPLLARMRYSGVEGLFDHLRQQGTLIGVLSDHPAAEKLAALGLKADVVAHAGGLGVPRQKPDPAGLRYLMEVAGASPAKTLMIGDRDDRDGQAARRADVDFLLRTDRPAGPDTFTAFSELAGQGAGRS